MTTSDHSRSERPQSVSGATALSLVDALSAQLPPNLEAKDLLHAARVYIQYFLIKYKNTLPAKVKTGPFRVGGGGEGQVPDPPPAAPERSISREGDPPRQGLAAFISSEGPPSPYTPQCLKF